MSGHIEVVRGDLTALAVDAIVNAANERLAPGGGVCGAIHRGAGPGLARACEAIGHCEVGHAVITDAFDLPSAHVIHTVGPVWHGGGHGEADQLARCYESSLEIASRNGLRTVAFPAISCGIFGYPPELAVPVAVKAVGQALARLPGIERVSFVVLDDDMEALYRAEIQKTLKK